MSARGLVGARAVLVLVLIRPASPATANEAAATQAGPAPALAPREAIEARQHRQRGQSFLDQGDLAAAMREFERALALDPRDAASHDAIGIILGETGKLDDAIAAFQKALAFDPRVAAPHFHLGLAYDRAGRTREAIGEYHIALRLQPDLIEATYGLSIACAEAGDLDGAIALLRQVIASKPQLVEAHYNLGLHLWERFKASVGPRQPKDLDEAKAELTQAVRLDSDEPRSHSALGQLLVDTQNLAPAIEHLHRAATLAPDNPEHAYNLGLALRLNGDVDGAEREFRKALRLNPGHALARRSLGLLLRQKGDLAAAAIELRQSVSQMPDDALGHHLLGTVLLKQGDLSSAVEELRQAVRLDPQLAEAHVNLAQALARTGLRDEALQEQTEIQRLNDRNAQLARSLILLETAATHLAHGQPAEAVTQLREATTLTPDFPEAQYQLGIALLASHSRDAPGDNAGTRGGGGSRAGGGTADRGATAEATGGSGQHGANTGAEAEGALRRAVALDAGHARAHAALGRLLGRRGDKAGAIVELRRATDLAPGLVDAQRELAKLAAEAKDWPTAVAAYTAVLVWDPAGATRGDTQRALAQALDAQSKAHATTR